MKRSASAMWNGDLKTGKGTISTDSGVLSNTQYSFSTRFENGAGTNPEELIGAAHAGCFSMALSAQLGEAGLVAQSIRTTATVTLEKTGDHGDPPRPHGQDSRCEPAGVRNSRREREGRLSGVQGAAGGDHARQEAGSVALPSGRYIPQTGGVVSRFALSGALAA